MDLNRISYVLLRKRESEMKKTEIMVYIIIFETGIILGFLGVLILQGM